MITRYETFNGPRGEEVTVDMDKLGQIFTNFICEEQHEKNMGWELSLTWYGENLEKFIDAIVAVKR